MVATTMAMKGVGTASARYRRRAGPTYDRGMRRMLVLLGGAFLIGACSWPLGGLDEVIGSGDPVTEAREVGGFDAVRLEGVGEVDVTEGDAISVEVTTDDNLLGRIATEVEGGTLVIGVEQGVSIVPRSGVTVVVVVPELTGVAVSGAGDVDVGGIEADAFEIDVSGAGSIAVEGLVADDLTVTLSGAGGVRIDGGEVVSQSVTLSGVGDYQAIELASATTEVRNSGVGSIDVWATERLVVDISGAGDVRYRGSPTTEVSITGVGSFEAVDG